MHTRPARHIVVSDGELFLMTASDPRFNRSHKPVTLAHETSRKTVVNDCTARLYLGDNGHVYAVGYDWSAGEVQPWP
jgi:hypothetical protein